MAICVYIANSLCYILKLTQLLKSTILQQKLVKKTKIYFNSFFKDQVREIWTNFTFSRVLVLAEGTQESNSLLMATVCPSKGQIRPDFLVNMNNSSVTKYGFPRWLSGKESACQCRRFRRLRFDPWIRKILWRRT